ncbi:hypothetical protein MJH12_19915, partial [bacterium]|nr:hypothetical protein [bacterium]
MSDEKLQEWVHLFFNYCTPNSRILLHIKKTYKETYFRVFKQWITDVLEIENSNFDMLNKLWCEETASLIFEACKTEEIHPSNYFILLKKLTEKRYLPAIFYIKDGLVKADANGLDPKKTASMAKVFILDPISNLKTLWPLIDKYEDIVKEIFIFVQNSKGYSFIRMLDNYDLVRIYIRLAQLYPVSENPRFTRGLVADFNFLLEFRDSLLTELENRGDVKSIETIQENLPNLDYLDHVKIRAAKKQTQALWDPFSVEQFRAIIKNPKKPIIRNEKDLGAFVYKVIKNYQKWISGETPLVGNFWNGTKPKDEGHLSNNLKVHIDNELSKNGIIVAREVELK